MADLGTGCRSMCRFLLSRIRKGFVQSKWECSVAACMGFYSAFPRGSISQKMKLLDLHHRHPMCPLRGTWGLLARESKNAETAIWARKLIDFCCKTRAGGKEKYHECIDMDLEHGRGSPEWWEMPGSAVLLVHVTPCAANPLPAPSSGTPPQNFCSGTQMLSPGPGWREEVQLRFFAVSWFLFQFNLQACWFLAVSLRVFKAIPRF